MDSPPDYSDFVESAPSASTLTELSRLAGQLQLAELEVMKKEEELKKAQQAVSEIAEREIPELMATAGLKEFTTASGIKLKIEDKVRCSVPEARRADAYCWLEQHGHGGMIKRTVAVAFSKDQQDAAAKLQAELRGRFSTVKEDQKVEPATLTAFVKAQLKAGGEIPLELFGVYQFQRAKIEGAKQSAFGD